METAFASAFTIAAAILAVPAASAQTAPPPAAGATGDTGPAQAGPTIPQADPAIQTDADTSSQLTDIVVTAQKRSERLMSVPISITALSGDALNRTGASNLTQLQGVAPGIYLSGNTGYSVTPIAIRGVSGTGNALGDEPVAVYIDGVFQNAQTISTNDFLDLGGLEVLRGPQASLAPASA